MKNLVILFAFVCAFKPIVNCFKPIGFCFGLLRYRGCRSGYSVRRRRLAYINNGLYDYNWARDRRDINRIEVIHNSLSHSGDFTFLKGAIEDQCTSPRPRQLLVVDTSNRTSTPARTNSPHSSPSIYLLSATSIAKPNAIQQLQADVLSNDVDVTIITESWLKPHHQDSVMSIPGYSLFRRDRRKRKGGGLAAYVKEELNASIHNQPGLYDDVIELLWVKFEIKGRSCFVGAMYHPPKPMYTNADIQRALETSLEEIFTQPGDLLVILAGDFNQLPDHLITSMGLVVEFNQPTHEGNSLDRIYASEHVYSFCRAFQSTVKTKHLAVIVRSDDKPIHAKKVSHKHSFRPRTPALHATFLLHLQNNVDWFEVLGCCETQLAFDRFYDLFTAMLNDFYPLKSVTTTSRDPPFITPEIKALLRKKNKLLRRNHTEAANAIACQIQTKIQIRNATTFTKPCKDGKELWKRVGRITGNTKQGPQTSNSSINADQLNSHYARISSDNDYIEPAKKLTCISEGGPGIDEFQIFNMLDRLTVTASGTDDLPHWFLCIAAPSIYAPVTHLFNRSLTTSVVSGQWKTSIITPVPKNKQPTQCSDYRPISIIPILSRLLEKPVVRNCIYPILTHPDTHHHFMDQFPFRPTGSTTSAIIHLTHRLSYLLQEHKFVHLIALDFSKAFDTVRHNTLMQKLAQFPLPDYAYNWVADFLLERKHLTRFERTLSTVLTINASIIQGSVIGPTAYVINASDLKTLNTDNSLDKYADDTYLIVPASKSHTIPTELDHVSEWATTNNLSLNVSKSCEMIVRRPRLAIDDPDFPPALPGVKRVSELNILGVYMSDKLVYPSHKLHHHCRCSVNVCP